MEKVEEKILNQIIADIAQLKTNVQQIHWYMRGKEFFELHPLMDTYSEQLNDQLDNVAERLIAIGGSPLSTTHEFIENTKIPDEKITWNTYSLVDLMDKLSSYFKTLRDDYTEAIQITDKINDLPTQDMINGCKMQIEKNIWMVNAFLNKNADQ